MRFISKTIIKESILSGIVLFLVAVLLLLIGLPKSPFLIIKSAKKATNKTELRLPSNSLSESLAVNACSEKTLENLYESAENLNLARSGLNVFKTRLNKEYKSGSKSFGNLANRILDNTASTSSNNKKCLLPLSFRVDSSLRTDIKTSELFEVSLGEQSVFCSKGKAFLFSKSNFYPITNSLESYSKHIKAKKVVFALKKQLVTLQLKKSKYKTSKLKQKSKLDQQIRKLNISLAYAKYFTKDSLVLGSFFNSVCKQAAATPACIAGQTQQRAMWKEEGVTAGRTCQSEPQTWTCSNDAIWVRSTGTFIKSSCFVEDSRAGNYCASGASSSISQYGITWTFDRAYSCGQFANGDYWVVPDPAVNQNQIKIIDINPKTGSSNAFSNGSMLNPTPNQTQGLYYRYNQITAADETVPKYDPAKNIALKQERLVSPNNSVFSVLNNPHTWSNPGEGGVEKTYFKETAILTVLGSLPPAGSFRPPYAGTDKTIKSNWNAYKINFAALRNYPIPKPSNAPSLVWLEEALKRPLIELNNHGQSNSDFKASWAESKEGGYPRRTYGPEITHISGSAGLLLNTDLSNAQKKKLAIYMIQWGIDTYALRNEGLSYWGQGGHQNGRLLPVYMAAKLLNDQEILDVAAGGGFSENAQHFFVDQAVIGTPRIVTNPPRKPYTDAMKGMPEWCSEYFLNGYNSAAWTVNPYDVVLYRYVTGGENASTAATLLIMENGRKDIKNEAFIRYQLERYYPRQKPTGDGAFGGDGNAITYFTRDMWDAYIKESPVPAQPYENAY